MELQDFQGKNVAILAGHGPYCSGRKIMDFLQRAGVKSVSFTLTEDTDVCIVRNVEDYVHYKDESSHHCLFISAASMAQFVSGVASLSGSVTGIELGRE